MLDKAQPSAIPNLDEAFHYRPSEPAKFPKARRMMGASPKPLLPRSLKEAHQLADIIHRSKLAPKGFDTPESCLVGILYGMEVGLSPIAALQRMAIIDGRPTIWGDAALALVQASGLLVGFREDLADTGTNVGLVATCTVTRHGRSEPVTRTFSVEDAKRAGLWQKPGPWSQYPKRMLAMRARGFALRDAFPDVLAGLYLREEIEPEQTRDEIKQVQSAASEELPPSKPVEPKKIDLAGLPRRAPPPPPISPAHEPVTEEAGFHTHEDANALVTLFDDALCCAFEPETLEEIREEFQPKIDRLGRTAIEEAGRVFLIHENRVADINMYPPRQLHTDDQPTETKICSSDKNISSALPSRTAISRRRAPRGFTTSRARSISLLALDARRRLSALHERANGQEEFDGQTGIEISAHVNNLTLTGRDTSASQYDPSQADIVSSATDLVLQTDI